jgi:hypothetical protein
LLVGPAQSHELSLVELLDTLIDKGVVLVGDAMISVNDVDLIYLGLRVVLASVDTLERNSGERSTGNPPAGGQRAGDESSGSE